MKLRNKGIVVMILICLIYGMKIPVYAHDMEFTECSKLMETQEKVEALDEPQKNAAVVVTFEAGSPVLITGESQMGWYRLIFQGQDCYVPANSLRTAELTEGESLEALDRELDEMAQTNKIIVEEVERMNNEKKRSVIWTGIIVVLVLSILGVGIYSTIKANRNE